MAAITASTAESLFFSLCETYFEGTPVKDEHTKTYVKYHPSLSPQLCDPFTNSRYFDSIKDHQLPVTNATLHSDDRIAVTVAPNRHGISAARGSRHMEELSEIFVIPAKLNAKNYSIVATRSWEKSPQNDSSYFVSLHDRDTKNVVAQFDNNWVPMTNPLMAAQNIILISGLLAAACPHPQLKHAIYRNTTPGLFVTEYPERDITLCK